MARAAPKRRTRRAAPRMNRSTALLLALTALLAHLLTVYQNAAGRLGPAFDESHVAYRIGRLAVHGPSGGQTELLESHPSTAWVVLAAFAERLTWPPTTTSQVVAILCALASVWVVSRFSPARLAGVIAPMLCVVSGPIATAAGGGSEYAPFTLCAITAFFAFEHGRSRLLGGALAAASLVRPEGLLLIATFVALHVAVRVWRADSGGRRLTPFAFVAPLLVEGVLAVLRWRSQGQVLAPPLAELLVVDRERYAEGLHFASDFVLHAGAPLLVVVPVALACAARLGGRATRALAVAAAWTAYVVLSGGSTMPFWVVMAPALPLLFLAVQDAFVELIDDRRLLLRRAAWVLFALALGSSALASKLPNDVGPLPLATWHRAWLGDERIVSPDPFERPRARAGVRRVVRDTERLRALGVFLRDQLDPRATVASPWPGAISYLSRRTVQDLFGRSTRLPGADRLRPWLGPLRTDLVAAISAEPDFVVPFLLSGESVPRIVPLVIEWFRRYDDVGPEEPRLRAFWEHLSNYELVAVPVADPGASGRSQAREPFYLLRHRRLGLRPRLELRREGARIAIEARHAGHPQLADLEVVARTAGGELRSLRPTGLFVPGRGIHARTNLLLTDTGDRAVRLMELEVPEYFPVASLTAVLRNPGSQVDQDFSSVSNEVVIDLRP